MSNLPTEKSILIVDDVVTIRQLITKNLKSLGFTDIHHADCITQAKELIVNQRIDLILCDWNMPGGDGIELLSYLREQTLDTLRLKKFIMITGAEDKVKLAMKSGANNVIHKPFTPEALKFKLELLWYKSD